MNKCLSWNPTTGCTKYSMGCENCYAERIANKLKELGVKKYENGFKLTLHPEVLKLPFKYNSYKVFFVNSMSDLFHEDIPIDFLLKVFDTMNKAYWHEFRILTKRIERAYEISKVLKWSPNIWLGVTVEHKKYIYRVEILKQIPAYHKFVNMEPLLSDMPKLDLKGIDFVRVGEESGPKARKMKMEWVEDIRNMCKDQRVPFILKNEVPNSFVNTLF